MMLRAVVSVHGHEHYVHTLKQEQREELSHRPRHHSSLLIYNGGFASVFW